MSRLRGVEALDEHVALVGALSPLQPAVVRVALCRLGPVLVIGLGQPPVLQILPALG